MIRIVVVANKWFEADPLMSVLSNPAARPSNLPPLENLLWPRNPQTTVQDIVARPRATLFLDSGRNVLVEVWCIQDLMNPFLSFSNTAEKARVLATIATFGKTIDFVIAFGTAGSAMEDINENGDALVGSSVFVHNPYKDPNSSSNWSAPSRMDTVIDSSTGASFLRYLEADSKLRAEVETRMIPELRSPASKLELLVSPVAAAVSEVNVVDYHDYGKCDQESVNAALAQGAKPLSIETTHGVIRLILGEPFVFVSGITDRFGKFNDDVTIAPSSAYPQNLVAAHNGALAVAWLLPSLANFLFETK
jgi:hypothetical protein